MAWTKVVVITGCDSGLGWAMAARAAREGLVTIAGMYNGSDTEAAEALKKLCVHPYKLDVTDSESVSKFRDYVENLLLDNPNYKLNAVVNNAGVMTIGQFEWHTLQIIENTINVNLLGPMRVVSSFLPELRKNAAFRNFKPRIINVASHCGLQPMPGFGPYSASKAGLMAWTRALHLEHFHDGLSAVSFIPGGFIGSSNLTANQIANGNAFLHHLTEEQRSKYEKRINTLNKHLGQVSNTIRFDSLNNEIIIETFVKALTDQNPQHIYKVEPWRYKFYYNLLKLPLPDTMHFWLIKKFLSFPDPE